VCEAAREAGIVQSANLNAPGQVVISGEFAAVDRACVIATERGARRAIKLEVSGAFHSPLMGSAVAPLAEALDAVSVRDALCPVVVNVTAEALRRGDALREALKAQLLGAVHWEESMKYLLELGAEGFIEIGTGRVLKGLLRTISKDTPCWNVEDPDSLQATLAALGVGAAGSTGEGAPAR
jgi:[acyl-carrier-protein] S-malonyltransferase